MNGPCRISVHRFGPRLISAAWSRLANMADGSGAVFGCMRIHVAKFAAAAMLAAIVSSPATAADITDQRGKTVSVHVPARRVVIFPPVLWNYMTVDGGT